MWLVVQIPYEGIRDLHNVIFTNIPYHENNFKVVNLL